MTMSKHFGYLFEEPAQDFFQKVAEAQAAVPFRRSAPMQKLASHGSDFEKVASRLDQDLYIIKTAGDSGVGLGTCRRAISYIEKLGQQTSMEDEEFAAIFDKVAGEAIWNDLSIARDVLTDGLPEEWVDVVDGELSSVGAELTKAASLDKEALLGRTLFRALGKARAGISGLAGGSARAVASGAGKLNAAINPFTKARRAARLEKSVALHGQRIKDLSKDIESAKGALETARKSGAGSFRIGGLESGLKSLEGRLAKQVSQGPKIEEKSKKAFNLRLRATGGKAVSEDDVSSFLSNRPAPSAQRRPDITPPAPAVEKQTDQLKTEMKADAAKASDQAADAAKGTADAAVAPTLKGSYEKLRDQGWGALSGSEKQKLINAGVVAAIGGRVLTGQGVVTGGEGVV
jgi:hypothetical protein